MKKLLLADDSITIQKVVELIFSGEEFEVRAVSDGEAAWEKLREERRSSHRQLFHASRKQHYQGIQFLRRAAHRQGLGRPAGDHL